MMAAQYFAYAKSTEPIATATSTPSPRKAITFASSYVTSVDNPVQRQVYNPDSSVGAAR